MGRVSIDNNKIFRYCVVVLFFVLVAFFARICAEHINPSTLSLYDLDEYAFTFVVSRVFDGIVNLRPMDIFNISFFSYGYGFFYPLVALASPALAFHSYPWAIFVIRFFSALWTLALLGLAAAWLSKRTGSWGWALVGVLLLLSLPAFLRQGLWIHPEPMMNFCVMATLIMAGGMQTARLRNNLLIGLIAGVALSVKFQALIYIPFPAMLLMGRDWIARDAGVAPLRRLALSLRPAVVMGVTALVIYVVLDPFLLIPIGQKAFWSDLQENLTSNRTNHFSGHLPSAGDKLAMLNANYLPALIILFAIITVGWLLATKRVYWKDMPTELCLMLCGAVTGAYVFATVQKVWPHYYALSYVLFLVGFVGVVGRAAVGIKWEWPVQWGLVAIAIVLVLVRTPPSLEHFFADDRPEAATAARVASLALVALPNVNQNTKVLISPRLPFDFQKLGLSLPEVKFIAGPLSLDDAAKSDLVIIRKDDIYFQNAVLDRRDAIGARTRQVRDALVQLKAGRPGRIRLCGEDQAVILLCRVEGGTVGG